MPLPPTVFPQTLFWSTNQLPVRSGQVDIVLADMPFGKAGGGKVDKHLLVRMPKVRTDNVICIYAILW